MSEVKIDPQALQAKFDQASLNKKLEYLAKFGKKPEDEGKQSTEKPGESGFTPLTHDRLTRLDAGHHQDTVSSLRKLIAQQAQPSQSSGERVSPVVQRNLAIGAERKASGGHVFKTDPNET